jgi:hypothetical protein
VHRDPGIFVEITPELTQWIEANDVDLLLRMPDASWGLMDLGMQAINVGSPDYWETVSPAKVIGALAKNEATQDAGRVHSSTEGPGEEDPVGPFDYLANDEGRQVQGDVLSYTAGSGPELEFGQNIAFRTRNDVMGVYSLENVKDGNSYALKMKIKLLQSSGTNHPKLNQTIQLLEQAEKENTNSDANQTDLLNEAWKVLQSEGGHRRYRKHRGYALDAIKSAITAREQHAVSTVDESIRKALSEIQKALTVAAVFEAAHQQVEKDGPPPVSAPSLNPASESVPPRVQKDNGDRFASYKPKSDDSKLDDASGWRAWVSIQCLKNKGPSVSYQLRQVAPGMWEIAFHHRSNLRIDLEYALVPSGTPRPTLQDDQFPWNSVSIEPGETAIGALFTSDTAKAEFTINPQQGAPQLYIKSALLEEPTLGAGEAVFGDDPNLPYAEPPYDQSNGKSAPNTSDLKVDGV